MSQNTMDWDLIFVLENATEAQADEMLTAIIAKAESMGLYVGGGISSIKPEAEAEAGDVQKEDVG